MWPRIICIPKVTPIHSSEFFFILNVVIFFLLGACTSCTVFLFGTCSYHLIIFISWVSETITISRVVIFTLCFIVWIWYITVWFFFLIWLIFFLRRSKVYIVLTNHNIKDVACSSITNRIFLPFYIWWRTFASHFLSISIMKPLYSSISWKLENNDVSWSNAIREISPNYL